MGKKTLKFDNVEVNKKEFHASKQPIALNQILISDKVEQNDKGFKYFIGYKDDNIIMYYLVSNEWIHKIFWGREKKYVFYD